LRKSEDEATIKDSGQGIGDSAEGMEGVWFVRQAPAAVVDDELSVFLEIRPE